MSYRIGAVSPDGVHIGGSFGSAGEFLIYDVGEDGAYRLLEKRKAVFPTVPGQKDGCGQSSERGCQGGNPGHANTGLVRDCCCVVCGKIGHPARRELESKAIAVFDVEGEIGNVLEKIIRYYSRTNRPRFPKV